MEDLASELLRSIFASHAWWPVAFSEVFIFSHRSTITENGNGPNHTFVLLLNVEPDEYVFMSRMYVLCPYSHHSYKENRQYHNTKVAHRRINPPYHAFISFESYTKPTTFRLVFLGGGITTWLHAAFSCALIVFAKSLTHSTISACERTTSLTWPSRTAT